MPFSTPRSISAFFNIVFVTIISGTMKSNTPVTLFIVVCTAINLLCMAYPDIMLMILTKAITAVHTYSHIGISITGRIFIRQTATNTKSAIESNLDPNSLTVFVFLAMVPSTVSADLSLQKGIYQFKYPIINA